MAARRFRFCRPLRASQRKHGLFLKHAHDPRQAGVLATSRDYRLNDLAVALRPAESKLYPPNRVSHFIRGSRESRLAR